MEKGVYEMLNQIDTNLDEYKEVEFSNIESKKNAKRILSKIKGEEKRKHMSISRRGKRIAIAGILLVSGFVSATTISYASDGKYFNYLYTFFNGSGVTYQEDNGESSMTVEMNATENPPVELINGNLYFIVDGNEIDITNQISDSKPYIGEVVDQQGNVHKFVIGGKAVEGEYGYQEFIFSNTGEFIASSGYYPSEDVPEWANVGREKLGLESYE